MRLQLELYWFKRNVTTDITEIQHGHVNRGDMKYERHIQILR